MSSFRKEAIKSLAHKYMAERDGALATANLYLDKAVGVGEHPNLIEEIDNQIEKAEKADSKLVLLESLLDTEALLSDLI